MSTQLQPSFPGMVTRLPLSSSASPAIDGDFLRSPFPHYRFPAKATKPSSTIFYSADYGLLHSQSKRERTLVINVRKTNVHSANLVLHHSLSEDLQARTELQIDERLSSLTISNVSEHIADAENLSESKDDFVRYFLQQGFPSKCIDKLVKIISARRLDGITTKRIDSLVQFLKSIGMDVDDVYRVLSRFSGIFCYDVDNPLRRNALILIDYGLNRKALIKLIEVFPRVLVCSFEYLRDHLVFIESFSGSKGNACKVIQRYPLILKYSIDQNLQPKLDYITSLGVPGESSRKFLVLRPQIFGLSVDPNLLRKMDLLVQLGFERNSTDCIRASLLLSTLSCELLQSRFNNLMELGLSRDEVVQIVRKQPDILGRRKEKILKKVDYLLNVMHRPLREVVKFPPFLSYSLENRIKYRHEVLSAWKANSALGRDYSLASILVISNRDFHRKFIECSCETFQANSAGCGGSQGRTGANMSLE